jgi:lipoate-protein ligase B
MRQPRIAVCRLRGLVDYTEATLLQKGLLARQKAGIAPDTLLLLEHKPVFTLGRLQESASNVLASHEEIAAAGASVIQSDRGGNVTFHGPGQLVAYPILNLRAHRQDLRWFVGALEMAMIATAAKFGIKASPGGADRTGVWVADRKLGAIGVRVSRWQSSHGIALNADVDLNYFGMIVPCGLSETPQVTSLTSETGRSISVDEVAPAFSAAFAQAFDSELFESNVDDALHEARVAAAMRRV